MCPPPSPTKPPVFGLPRARMKGTQWEERGHTRDDSDDSDDDDDNGGKSHTSSGLSSSSSHSRTTQALSSATASWQNDNPDSSQDGIANKGSTKSNSGAIAAGVIVGLVALAVLTFLWWRRRNGRGLRARTQIEIDPMSSLNGEVYPRSTVTARKDAEDERKGLIQEDFQPNPVGVESRRSSRPPHQAQFWQVQNVHDTDEVHPIPLPGYEKKKLEVAGYGEKPGMPGTSLFNMAPKVPEKDSHLQLTISSSSTSRLQHMTSSSSRSEQYSTVTSMTPEVPPNEHTASRSSTLEHPRSLIPGVKPPDIEKIAAGDSVVEDVSGPSAWKPYSATVEDAGSATSSRLSEANDLAFAAREEVSDLRRRVEMLKQENAELAERRPESSFERLPAYDE